MSSYYLKQSELHFYSQGEEVIVAKYAGRRKWIIEEVESVKPAMADETEIKELIKQYENDGTQVKDTCIKTY